MLVSTPTLIKSERFEMLVDPTFLRRIDDWRRKQPDLPSRAEAIRRLVEQALKRGRGDKRGA
jgi:uncharacterized protein